MLEIELPIKIQELVNAANEKNYIILSFRPTSANCLITMPPQISRTRVTERAGNLLDC